MNGTPRGLNRFLLSLVGLVLLGVGAGLVAVAALPAVSRWWQAYAQAQLDWLRREVESSEVLPTGESWIWVAGAVLCLLVVIAMVGWIAGQGRGRASTLLELPANPDDGSAAGTVGFSCAVAEQALKSALMERTDLLGVSVASYDMAHQTALKVRVIARQGVAPQQIVQEVGELVTSLDQLLGIEVPVLLSISAGARSRFTKAERVR
ncbi:hypothetical protein ACFUCV_14530 [Specibacter sp. NPDC057265]|uniref:hypothetical protein n=1 Tax=Specibacter sp. NPDC057265 TaxID=3346075 RepID=UPI00363ED828